MKKYCYLKPDYPDRGFVIVTFLMKEDVVRDIYPLYNFSRNIEETYEYIHEFNKELKNKLPEFETPDVCIILEADFERLYPLRHEFWNEPSVNYGFNERKKLFVNLMDNPLAHEILITPGFKKKKKWELISALPLRLNTPEKVVEQFMMTSDAPVDERASHAAFYKLNLGKRLFLKTGKLEEVEVIQHPIKN